MLDEATLHSTPTRIVRRLIRPARGDATRADGTALVNYRLDSDSAAIHVTSPQPLWLYAYFDATEICEFVLQCCKLCVEEDLAAEVEYLRSHDQTVRELKTWLDMRQAKLNSLIDLILQGTARSPGASATSSRSSQTSSWSASRRPLTAISPSTSTSGCRSFRWRVAASSGFRSSVDIFAGDWCA
jgi:hypothetical protein